VGAKLASVGSYKKARLFPHIGEVVRIDIADRDDLVLPRGAYHVGKTFPSDADAAAREFFFGGRFLGAEQEVRHGDACGGGGCDPFEQGTAA
jgi:hypothetical protein